MLDVVVTRLKRETSIFEGRFAQFGEAGCDEWFRVEAPYGSLPPINEQLMSGSIKCPNIQTIAYAVMSATRLHFTGHGDRCFHVIDFIFLRDVQGVRVQSCYNECNQLEHKLEIRTEVPGHKFGRTYELLIETAEQAESWAEAVLEQRDALKPSVSNTTLFWMSVQQRIKRTYKLHAVKLFFSVMIFGNFVVNAVQAELKVEPGSKHYQTFRNMEIAFTVFFSVELALLFLACTDNIRSFFLSAFRMFDLLLVACSVLALVLEDVPGLGVLRVIRAFRIMRVFGKLSSLRSILKALLSSWMPVVNAMMIVFFTTAVYGLLANNFFASMAPFHFDTFSRSFWTMFTVITFDGWVEMVNTDMTLEGGKLHAGVVLFFGSFIVLVVWTMMSVVVAIMVENFQREAEKADTPLEQHRGNKCLDPLISSLITFHSARDLGNRIYSLFQAIDLQRRGSVSGVDFCDSLRKLEFQPGSTGPVWQVSVSAAEFNVITRSGELLNTAGEIGVSEFERILEEQLANFVQETASLELLRSLNQSGGVHTASIVLSSLKLLNLDEHKMSGRMDRMEEKMDAVLDHLAHSAMAWRQCGGGRAGGPREARGPSCVRKRGVVEPWEAAHRSVPAALVAPRRLSAPSSFKRSGSSTRGRRSAGGGLGAGAPGVLRGLRVLRAEVRSDASEKESSGVGESGGVEEDAAAHRSSGVRPDGRGGGAEGAAGGAGEGAGFASGDSEALTKSAMQLRKLLREAASGGKVDHRAHPNGSGALGGDGAAAKAACVSGLRVDVGDGGPGSPAATRTVNDSGFRSSPRQSLTRQGQSQQVSPLSSAAAMVRFSRRNGAGDGSPARSPAPNSGVMSPVALSRRVGALVRPKLAESRLEEESSRGGAAGEAGPASPATRRRRNAVRVDYGDALQQRTAGAEQSWGEDAGVRESRGAQRDSERGGAAAGEETRGSARGRGPGGGCGSRVRASGKGREGEGGGRRGLMPRTRSAEEEQVRREGFVVMPPAAAPETAPLPPAAALASSPPPAPPAPPAVEAIATSRADCSQGERVVPGAGGEEAAAEAEGAPAKCEAVSVQTVEEAGEVSARGRLEGERQRDDACRPQNVAQVSQDEPRAEEAWEERVVARGGDLWWEGAVREDDESESADASWSSSTDSSSSSDDDDEAQRRAFLSAGGLWQGPPAAAQRLANGAPSRLQPLQASPASRPWWGSDPAREQGEMGLLRGGNGSMQGLTPLPTALPTTLTSPASGRGVGLQPGRVRGAGHDRGPGLQVPVCPVLDDGTI